jgi:ADP-heptose:LPS heptosyltransferase
MKKLLYIGRPNLGENMFATPVLDFLSKEYEITLLIPTRTAKAFCDYPFIKRILTGCNHGDAKAKLSKATLDAILQIFNPNEETFYTHHHDNDTNFLINHPELGYIKKLNV